MNRHLKERIVGATVIVALGIIVIPWLLDGPAQAPRPVERTLELPSGEAPGRVYSIPLDPAAGPPVQVGNEAREEAEASSPEPSGAVRRPAGEPVLSPPIEPERDAPPEQPSQPPPRPATQAVQPSEEKPARQAPEPADAGGDWAVQVGSFSQADNARALRAQLAAAGFDAFVSRVATDAGTMHRVRVGPAATRADAEKLLARLRAAGHPGARVVQAAD